MDLGIKPKPCINCGCPSRWTDGAGRKHCDECDPPRHKLLVKSREIIAGGEWQSWPEWALAEIEIIRGNAKADAESKSMISFDPKAAPPSGWQWALGDPVRVKAFKGKSKKRKRGRVCF